MSKIFATMLMYASFPLIIAQQSRRDIVLASSVRPSIPSVYTSVHQFTLFVCPEPHLSTYLSYLIHSRYK